MKMDLEKMSPKELTALKADIEKALVAAEERTKREALEAAKKAAAEFGYSLDELSDAIGTGKSRKGGARKSKTAPKYRNPANPDQTWSGMGRKPQWIHDAIANGVDLMELEI